MPSSSGAEESDQQREAEAYNYNIYMMVGTPYLLLAGVGLLIYRGLRRKALMDRTAFPPVDGKGPEARGMQPAPGAGGA